MQKQYFQTLSEKVFCSSFPTSSKILSETDAGNTIFLKIKVFGRKINENALAMYSIKITARSSFMRLIIIIIGK